MSTKRSKVALQPVGGSVCPAAVVSIPSEPGRVEVRVASAEGSRVATARLALSSPYRPAEGDRVLVAEGEGEVYVIGVLNVAHAPSLAIPGGGMVAMRDGAVEIEDEQGRVVVRYAGGAAEIAAPAGDLTLAAPAGRVVVRAGRGVDVAAGADPGAARLCLEPEGARLDARRLEVEAETSQVVTTEATVIARRIATTASSLVQSAERLEIAATSLIEKTRDCFRDAAELLQVRAGRARTIVKGSFTLHARRTTLDSTEDTSIDGSRVLLG